MRLVGAAETPSSRRPLTEAQRALLESDKTARFVERTVAQITHSKPGTDPDEVRALVYEALVDRVVHYDPSRGVSFSGYASTRVLYHVLEGLSAPPEQLAAVAFARPAVNDRPLPQTIDRLADTPEACSARLLKRAGAIGAAAAAGLLGAAPTDTNPERNVSRAQASVRLTEVLGTLTAREKTVLHSRVYGEETCRAVSEGLGCDPSTVLRIQRAAVAKLRELFEGQGIERAADLLIDDEVVPS
ncbi:MAG: sigma-70 family RNA polymerase sigma factor [Myxococcota bacterium]